MKRFDHCIAALTGKDARKFQRFLEVMAMLDKFRALGQHGAILPGGVAVGHHNHGFHSQQAGSHGHTLAKVAARGRHYA